MKRICVPFMMAMMTVMLFSACQQEGIRPVDQPSLIDKLQSSESFQAYFDLKAEIFTARIDYMQDPSQGRVAHESSMSEFASHATSLATSIVVENDFLNEMSDLDKRELWASAKPDVVKLVLADRVFTRESCLSIWVQCEADAYDQWDKDTDECIVLNPGGGEPYIQCLDSVTNNYLVESDICETAYNGCEE